MKQFYLIGLSIVTLAGGLKAQISYGGDPLSETLNFETDVEVVEISQPDLTEKLAEDIERASFKYPPRDAIVLPLNMGLDNSGTWTELDNGDRIWQLEIAAEGAKSLELFYSDFYLPLGSKLFIYSPDMKQILGAFNHNNNKDSETFATDMIYGDRTIIEYYEPLISFGEGRFNIVDIGYGYRDLRSMGGSQPCEVDVACSEGNNWVDQINSVVRVRPRINGNLFWCTGVIMNNTELDCKPYVLSALHCALNGSQSTTADYNLYKFYFKFQKPDCDSGNGSAAKTITGCSLRADSNDDGGDSGSDFMLMELSEDIPANYDPYWAGWNRSSSSNGGGIAVHHPAGDVKKISTYNSSPITSGWGVANTHFRVNWIETDNGWGVTEGGSSGCPLFNSDGLVIGTLTGGGSFCEGVNPPNGPDDPDFFGKMSRHWASNPNPSNEKLKEWLDPSGSSSSSVLGSANPCGNVSTNDIEVDNYFKVFPNPTNGNLTLDFVNEDIKVEFIRLIDSRGRMIESFSSQSYPVQFDLNEYDGGLYQIQIILEDTRVFNQKIILNK